MTERGVFPLPLTVEELTPAWLTAAIRTRAPGATVLDFQVVDVVHSTTTKARLRLDLDDAAREAGIPESVIVKGGFQERSRLLAGMHRMEVRGYRDVFPVAPLPSPRCYFADFDEDRLQGIVIMEDLDVRGVEHCHTSRPQSYGQVATRLSVLAAFHARTYGSVDLEPGGRWHDLPDFLEGIGARFFGSYVTPEQWLEYVAAPRGGATSVRFHDREQMIDLAKRMIPYGQSLPQCVLHGDTHLGNLYLDRDGTPGFYDSLSSRGPVMLEIAYHISAAVDVADRPRWEEGLVGHYLGALRGLGVDAPSLAEAMRQYSIFLVYGFFIWMAGDNHFQTETVNTTNAARVSAAMIDNGTLEALASLPPVPG